LVIFDCNGALVDSEPIASAVLSEALRRVGVALSAAGAMRRFHGRHPADVFAAIEVATGRRLPPDFSTFVAAETLGRLPPGIAAAMTPIGFVGGNPTPSKLASELLATGARTVVADLRGW